LPPPPEVVVGVVVVVEVVEPVVVGEVVFVDVVVEPVLVPVVVEAVELGTVVGEEPVDAVEEPPLWLSAITTTAITRPTITAIRPAIKRWMLPWGRPPGPCPSGPIIRVGSSCI
jgi:hypothetical protein